MPYVPLEKLNKDYITPFCMAIQKMEGWYVGSRSYRNNNPGNLKYVGQPSAVGKDSNNFCIFPDYSTGFDALKRMVKNACMGKSDVYFPTDSIYNFFSKYAPASDKNNPKLYAEAVAKAVELPPTTLLKDLI